MSKFKGLIRIENDEDADKTSNEKKGKGKSNKGKPGERKPKRDATGWSTEETGSETDAM